MTTTKEAAIELIDGYLPGQPELTGPMATALADALDEADLLRQGACDWPNLPPGSLLLGDIRVMDYLGPDGRPMFNIRYDAGLSYSNALGLLAMASSEVVNLWRDQRPDDPAPPTT